MTWTADGNVLLPWLTVVCGALVTAGVFCAGNTYGGWVLILLLPIIAVLAIVLRLPRFLIFLAAAMLVLSFAYAKIRTVRPAANDISAYLHCTVVLTAKLLSSPGMAAPAATAGTSGRTFKIQVLELIFPARKKLSGCARLFIIAPAAGPDSCYQGGQILQIKGQVCSLTAIEQPWLTGLGTAARHQGMFCQIQADSTDVTVLGRDEEKNTAAELVTLKSAGLIAAIRQLMTKAHVEFLGAKAGSLLASMVLGDQAVSLDTELLQAFRKIGLSHIVAASGFNLTVVTMMTYWILRHFCSNRRLVTIIVCCNVVIYAALAGLCASIIRAGIACFLLLAAKYLNRRLHGPAAFSLCLIINIVIDPSVLMEPGGQLSYAATAGIIFGAQIFDAIISFGSNSKLIRMLSGSLSVVLMAQLAVLPIQIFHFWQIGVLFLPANLLVDPFVTPITVIGSAASVSGLVNFPGLPVGLTICRWLDSLAAIPLQMIIYMTERMAACDLAVLNTGKPQIFVIVLYYFMFALWLICLQKKCFRTAATVLFLFSLAGLFYQPQLIKPVAVLLPHSIICIDKHRQAFCFGENNRQASRILAYYAARDSRDAKSLPLQFSPQEDTIINVMNDGETATQAGERNYLLVAQRKAEPGTSQEDRYIILLEKERNYSKQFKSQLQQGIRLSKSEVICRLKDIDWRICCPRNSFRVYYLVQNSLAHSLPMAAK